jgi:hypothetical protein
MLEGEDPPRRSKEAGPQGQHTNRVTAFPSQCLCSGIWTVAKLLDRSVNALAYIWTHIGCAVDDARDRLLRHTGRAGDIDHDNAAGAHRG